MDYKLFSLVSGTLILSGLSANAQKNNTKPNILSSSAMIWDTVIWDVTVSHTSAPPI